MRAILLGEQASVYLFALLKSCHYHRGRGSRRRRFICIFLFIVLGLAFAYYELNLLNYAWYNNSSRRLFSSCVMSAENQQQLEELSRDLHLSLKALNLTHWLAYGSLWGALRNEAPLPWDNDVDIGVLQEEMNENLERLQYELANKQMKVNYQYWGGFYRVTRDKTRADLMVFHNNSEGNMERVGIESYIFFVNYKKMHIFPSRLIRSPLPLAKFAGMDVPVPQGGFEIQKYHYPYDWWKENKPAGC